MTMDLRILLLVCFVGAFPQIARAEIILDDFDDPAEVTSPQMKGVFVDTEHVGPLNATRSIRIVTFQGDPDGRLDSGISSTSILTGQITRLNPFPSGETLVAVQSNYKFPLADLSQGGQNNAFFFDFVQLTSEMPPSLFTIFVQDRSDFYLYFEGPFRLRANPFTVVVPFDGFAFRDGQPGLPDYRSIQSVNISIRPSQIAGGGPDPLNFFMQLDRIRVGQVVPEPGAFALFVAGLVTLVFARIRSPD